MNLRPFSWRMAAAAAFLCTTAQAGPLSLTERAGSIPQAGLPVQARPWTPDPLVIAIRDPLAQHLKELGVPGDDVQAILVRIEGAAQQRFVPGGDIAATAGLATDPEGAAKAQDMLTAFAELSAFGRPLSVDLDVQGAPRMAAESPDKAPLLPGEIELPGMEPIDAPEPRIGGICQACPTVDYGPFVPTTSYQFHTGLTSGSGDCAWYAFNVILGNRYEFTTCSPGAAAWDTVLEVYDPTVCGAFLARNDDCSVAPVIRQSTVTWDATFTGVAHVKLRGSAGAWGSFTLAYRNLGVMCESCVNPDPVPLATPVASPACISGATGIACPSDYYTVSLVAGETYQFTTCPAVSPAANASFDTLLRLWSPSCGIVTSNDDACSTSGATSRSTLAYTAVTSGPHRIQVTGRTFSTGLVSTGSYTLCYRRTSSSCATCSAGPYLGTFTPVPSCQTVSASVTACQDSYYQAVLTASTEYEFTTCSIAGACTGGSASFDTVLELYNTACSVVATNDDGCGGSASKITYTVPPGLGGVYKLLVRGKSGATGSYTLTHREVTQACVAPTTVAVAPGTGGTGPSNCLRTETFSLATDVAASLPVSYSWSITPPPGGVAAPPTGIVTSATVAGAATFTTTLSGEGTYTVDVVASNSCGSASRSVAYVLVDNIRPTVTAPAGATVECDAVPPAADPVVHDNCDPSPAVALTETITPGTCPGNYTIRRQWVATDRSGNVSSPAVQVVVVRDRTAPVLTAETDVKYCAYPPNHDVVCFDRTMFSPAATDNCSEPVTWRFVRVTSSEEALDPCGSGNQDPDVFVSPDGQTFCVRVERCGNDPAENDGRRYLVEAAATDACNNTSGPQPIGFILVPHDSADTSGCIYPTPIPIP